MGSKRRQVPKSKDPLEPLQKHHRQLAQDPAVEEQIQFEKSNLELEVVEDEDDDGFADEVDDEDEEDEDEDDDEDDDDDEEEPISKLLEPLTKEQLINLLNAAADKHGDVADRIRKVADEDPSHRKIFVHGLSWDTNAENLTEVFRQYGEIEDCRAVCDKVSGKSKGYGFILFKTRSAARKALVEPQKKIGNRMTACQLAAIGPVAAPSTLAPSSNVSEYTQRKIYVSNVGAELDPQKLLSFFSKYGEIEEGPLGLDKATGKPKGFCLFVYKKMESAKKALEEPHKNFGGHILHCQRAIDGSKPGKHQNQHQNYNPQHASFQKNENPNFSVGIGGSSALAAPGVAGLGTALNPALGQALTALIASQGAGLGLTNLLGAMNQGVSHGVQGGGGGGYGSQSNISPGGMIGGYGNQGMQQQGVGYAANQQMMGQSGSGRGQHGFSQFGVAAPYMDH